MACYDFNCALVRGLPASFLDSLKMHPPPEPINMALAHEQHHAYTQLIQELVGRVVEVPADEACPDSVFIEDTILAVGSTFILTRPGAPQRKPEVLPVREAVAKLLGTTSTATKLHAVVEPGALDGGDVMFDGSCLWVGLSTRSNAEAVRQLLVMMAPQGVPVVGLMIQDPAGGTLHLKSMVSAFAPHHILAADNAAGHALVAAARADSTLASAWKAAGDWPQEDGLRVTYVPDQLCANVLRIGKHIVMQKGFPRSEAIIQTACEEAGLTLHSLSMSELAKADGALTCCSVLMRV